MAAPPNNIVVVGGSYVGLNAARELMGRVPPTHRVLLIEPRSHFNHIFTFPRFAILSGHEHKAFVPYTGLFPPSSPHRLIHARVDHVYPDHVQIDAEWDGSRRVPFDYLVLATGTHLAAPSMMPYHDRVSSVQYLQAHQHRLRQSQSVTVVGGGAVGVQMALDLKDVYPDKDVAVVHARDRLMPAFHPHLHEILRRAFEEKGIRLITNARASLPADGCPPPGHRFRLPLLDGRQLATDFVIVATGQRPNNQLLASLPTSRPTGLLNPTNGFVAVTKTLQLDDRAYPHIFAVGDIADTALPKAARPGAAQAHAAAQNILSLIHRQPPAAEWEPSPRAIHLTLGLKRNIIFRNPDEADGHTEPTVIEKLDGREDMGVDGMWRRMNVPLPPQHHAPACPAP